ncbi:thioredoxin-like protein 4A [Grus japonensis]|uniref:Thioredoxin-like protein 4A n=1 Tax=Grus japonensis TaxID=30415 RepID=A0ABC9WEN6_GRUJA
MPRPLREIPPPPQGGSAFPNGLPACTSVFPHFRLLSRFGSVVPFRREKDAHGARHPPFRMSYMLPHLHNGWQVDQAILSEEDRVVVIRFGHDWDPTCMKMDEVLYSIAEKKWQIKGGDPSSSSCLQAMFGSLLF